MIKTFDVAIDTQQVEGLAERLGRFESDTLARVLTDATNEVTDRTYDTAVSRMRAGINLTELYVTSKMTVRQAQVSMAPKASIIASGLVTTLGHYGAKQVSTQAIRPKRAKGNAALGISPGNKPAGVQVEVTRGMHKTVTRGFLISKFKDTEGNPMIFERTGIKNSKGKEKIAPMFGPAVYQLFKYQIARMENEIEDDLSKTVADRAEEALKKAVQP